MLAKSQPAPIRRPDDGYILIEDLGSGSRLQDVFGAPSNAEAVARVQSVIGSGKAELWRGEQLIWSGGLEAERDVTARPCGGQVLS